MWMFGLYLLMGLMTWVVYDKAAKDLNTDPCDAIGMVILIIAWPWYLWTWLTEAEEDGPE